MGINIKSLLRFPSCGGRKIDARSVGGKIFIFVGHKYSCRVLHFWSDFSKLASDCHERHNLCKTLKVLSQLTATWIFDRYKMKLCCERSNFAFKSQIKVWLLSGSFSIIETQFWFSIFFLWSLLRMAIWMYPQSTGWRFPAAERQQWLMALQDLIKFPSSGFKSNACRRYRLL